jgi:hypothetical protein
MSNQKDIEMYAKKLIDSEIYFYKRYDTMYISENKYDGRLRRISDEIETTCILGDIEITEEYRKNIEELAFLIIKNNPEKLFIRPTRLQIEIINNNIKIENFERY